MYVYCICGKEGDLRVLLFRHLASSQDMDNLNCTLPLWKKLVCKGYILLNSIFMIFKKKCHFRYSKQITACKGFREDVDFVMHRGLLRW